MVFKFLNGFVIIYSFCVWCNVFYNLEKVDVLCVMFVWVNFINLGYFFLFIYLIKDNEIFIEVGMDDLIYMNVWIIDFCKDFLFVVWEYININVYIY